MQSLTRAGSFVVAARVLFVFVHFGRVMRIPHRVLLLLATFVRLLLLDTIKPETLKDAIDPADGKVLGRDWKDGAEG